MFKLRSSLSGSTLFLRPARACASLLLTSVCLAEQLVKFYMDCIETAQKQRPGHSRAKTLGYNFMVPSRAQTIAIKQSTNPSPDHCTYLRSNRIHTLGLEYHPIAFNPASNALIEINCFCKWRTWRCVHPLGFPPQQQHTGRRVSLLLALSFPLLLCVMATQIHELSLMLLQALCQQHSMALTDAVHRCQGGQQQQ